MSAIDAMLWVLGVPIMRVVFFVGWPRHEFTHQHTHQRSGGILCRPAK